MKLALGTVQFGMNYGIANMNGQVTCTTAKRILNKAKLNGLDTLDTATSYGDSESCLGEIGVKEWKVISKLPNIPDECTDYLKFVLNSVNESLHNLNVEQIYGLLLHRPNQLLGSKGNILYEALSTVKRMGLVEKIGVSIYDPLELEDLCKYYDFDLVQVPFNIFDRRIIESGWMNRLKKKNIELHVRSVFLQGLLLMNADERPKIFNRWLPLWEHYGDWLKQYKLSPMQACLRYVLSFEEIDKVIIGVDNTEQLQEILNAVIGTIPPFPADLSVKDLDLLNPACWDSLTEM